MAPLPLTDRYPGVARVARVGLVSAPTPVESGQALLGDEGVTAPAGLWIKRDDLTSPRYGGNKTRKLEFLLGEALERGSRSVITFGAYGSNHALATAVHASDLGLEPHVVLSPQAPGPFAARTLRAHAGVGTRLHLAQGWDGKRVADDVRRELTARDGIEPAVIPMGGTSHVGALGYVNAAFELLDQVAALGLPVPSRIYVAGGTLGTAVGLAIGLAAADAPAQVVAVRVTPTDVATDAVADELIADTIAFLRSLDDGFPALARDDVRLELRHDWFEPGYGVVTPETTEAVARAAARGLSLETTYTGKAFAALLDDARRGRVSDDDHVLFWDTYNSAPMPPEGSDDALPEPLRDYVAECDRLFGRS